MSESGRVKAARRSIARHEETKLPPEKRVDLTIQRQADQERREKAEARSQAASMGGVLERAREAQVEKKRHDEVLFKARENKLEKEKALAEKVGYNVSALPKSDAAEAARLKQQAEDKQQIAFMTQGTKHVPKVKTKKTIKLGLSPWERTYPITRARVKERAPEKTQASFLRPRSVTRLDEHGMLTGETKPQTKVKEKQKEGEVVGIARGPKGAARAVVTEQGVEIEGERKQPYQRKAKTPWERTYPVTRTPSPKPKKKHTMVEESRLELPYLKFKKSIEGLSPETQARYERAWRQRRRERGGIGKMGYRLQFEMWGKGYEGAFMAFHWNSGSSYLKPVVSKKELKREQEEFQRAHPEVEFDGRTFMVVRRYDIYTGEWV